MPPVPAFDSASAVYPLYTSLLKAGARPEDMNVGSFQRDAAHPESLGQRVGAGDPRLDEKEVVLFVAESFEKFSDPLSKWAGTSPLFGLSGQGLAKARTFITVLRKVVASRFPSGSDAATEALAYGCFVFFQFPTKAEWDDLPASTQRAFIATHFPELEKLGLGPLASNLGQDGGLGQITLNWTIFFGEFNRPLRSISGMPWQRQRQTRRINAAPNWALPSPSATIPTMRVGPMSRRSRCTFSSCVTPWPTPLL